VQVDAKHVTRHLDEAEKDEGRVSEAIEQVALADTILLNKTDLVSFHLCFGGGEGVVAAVFLCTEGGVGLERDEGDVSAAIERLALADTILLNKMDPVRGRRGGGEVSEWPCVCGCVGGGGQSCSRGGEVEGALSELLAK
jgi:hypothetical protein